MPENLFANDSFNFELLSSSLAALFWFISCCAVNFWYMNTSLALADCLMRSRLFSLLGVLSNNESLVLTVVRLFSELLTLDVSDLMRFFLASGSSWNRKDDLKIKLFRNIIWIDNYLLSFKFILLTESRFWLGAFPRMWRGRHWQRWSVRRQYLSQILMVLA